MTKVICLAVNAVYFYVSVLTPKYCIMRISVLIASLLTIATFSITLSVSCTKDPCKDISCLNGGSCNGGSCVCLSGYTGSRCETKILPCVINNTAEVKFSNRSSSSTYTVIWDGSIITTVAAGATSDVFTVAAGQHTLEFRYSNSSTSSCTPSTPNVAQCSSMVYWCSN